MSSNLDAVAEPPQNEDGLGFVPEHDVIGFVPEPAHERELGFIRETSRTPQSPDRPVSAPALPLPDWFQKLSPEEQKQYATDARATLPENPATTLSRLGKGTTGLLADVGTMPDRDPQQGRFENARAGFNLEQTPIEKTMATPGMPAGITFPYKVGSSMVETGPKLAAVMASGPAAPITAAALFGYDDTGKFHPVQAVVAAALPMVGKFGGALAESLAARLGVSSDAVLSWIKAGGSYASANALLAGQSAVEISRLPPEQRQQAIIDSSANILAQGLLGLTEFHGANAEGKALDERSTHLANLKALLNSTPEVIPGTERLMISPPGEKANVSAPGEQPAPGPTTETGAPGPDKLPPGYIRQGNYVGPSAESVGELEETPETPATQPAGAKVTYPPADEAGQSLEEGTGSNGGSASTLSQYTPGAVAPESLPADGARNPQRVRELWQRAAAISDESHRHAATLPRKEDGSLDFKAATDEQVDRLFDLDAQLSDVRAEILKQFSGTPGSEDTTPSTKGTETDSAQETPEPAKQQELGLVESVVSALEKQAGRAEERIAGRSGIKFGSGPLHEVPNIADWSIIGAAKMARGTVNAVKWSKEMIAHVGEAIKPHLEDVFKRSRTILRQTAQHEATQQSEVERIIGRGEGVEARANGLTDAMVDEGETLIREQITRNGKEDVRQWVADMEKLFGQGVRPNLQEIYLQARRGLEMPTRETRQRTPFAGRRATIKVGEAEALRQVLKAAETAGAAGRAAAASEFQPKIAELKQQLSESLTKAQALAIHLQGQEKGAKIGAAAKQAELAMAQRWMDAEARDIQTSLTDLLKASLPVAERGKFTQRILNASRPPSLLSKEPLVMQQRAAKVASEIIFAGETHQRKTLTADIKSFGEKWADSAQVDVNYRRSIRQELAKFELLKKSGDLPLDVLQAFKDRLVSLKDIGRSEAGVRRSVEDWMKEFAMRELADSQTVPLEQRQEFRPRAGEKMTFSQKLGNRLRQAMNKLEYTDRALMPIDAMLDLLDGGRATYNGWLFRRFRAPVDLGYNNVLLRREEMTGKLDQFVKAKGLNQQNSERIGILAQTQQKGGRERLIKAGIKPAEIDRILKSLTPDERQAYQLMREAMDKAFPEVQDLMRKLYNIDVKAEPNYFPMQRDWKAFEPELPEAPEKGNIPVAFDAQATYKLLQRDYLPGSTDAPKGFTIERQPGAATPIKIDAFEVFRQHSQDASYLIEMQPILKAAGEMVRDDLFAEKYGKVGQRLVLDWVDTVARQGGVDSLQRWKLLDTLRRRTSLGVIGFRLSSQFVHLANIPLAMAHVGTGFYYKGFLAAMTQQGQKFLADSFRETHERAGSEPAQAELRPGRITTASFAIARTIDRLNAQATVLGAYMRGLSDRGINPDSYANAPVDREAQAQAMVRARRAVASPLSKDVPQAISRGAITGRNLSIAKAIFQFQNIFLDQWSNIRLDFAQAGLKEGNRELAAKMAAALAGMVLVETGIKYGAHAAISGITGSHAKKEKTFQDELLHESLRRFPSGSQLSAMLTRQNTGVPVIDALVQTIYSAGQAVTAKTDKQRTKAKIRAVSGAAQLAGVPGASQIGEIVEKSQ